MREITIRANGCHDCKLIIYMKDFEFGKLDRTAWEEHCALHGKVNSLCIAQKSFHPDCPMKEVEGTELFSPDETCKPCRHYKDCHEDCGGFAFEKESK